MSIKITVHPEKKKACAALLIAATAAQCSLLAERTDGRTDRRFPREQVAQPQHV